MNNYKIWNRIDDINGVEANHFLSQEPFKNYDGDIILIYNIPNRVSQVECKDILAAIYDINANLEIDEFMAQYFAKIKEIENQSDENK